ARLCQRAVRLQQYREIMRRAQLPGGAIDLIGSLQRLPQRGLRFAITAERPLGCRPESQKLGPDPAPALRIRLEDKVDDTRGVFSRRNTRLVQARRARGAAISLH